MAPPYTLVLETSAPAASLLLAGPDGFVTGREFSSDRSHNAALFGPLAEVLEGIEPSRIARILVGSGPGSYSGTRVGIAAAQGIALAAGCPVIAVPSILAAPSAADGADCFIVGDARRGSFWISRVAGGEILREPELIDAGGLVLETGGAPVVTLEASLKDPFPAGMDVRRETPTAALLWAAWQAAPGEAQDRWAAEPPQPLYLRPPHITAAKPRWGHA